MKNVLEILEEVEKDIEDKDAPIVPSVIDIADEITIPQPSLQEVTDALTFKPYQFEKPLVEETLRQDYRDIFPKPEMFSILDTVTDVFMRPEYAHTAIAKVLAKEPLKDIPTALPKAYWRGLTGKEKTEWGEALEEVGVPKILARPLGFAIAVPTDVETMAVGKGIGLGLKGLKETDFVKDVGKAIGKTTLGKGFIKTPLQHVATKYRHLASAKHEELLSKVIKYCKEMGLRSPEEHRAVTRAIADYEYYKEASPKIQWAAEKAKEWFMEMLDENVKLGYVTPEEIEKIRKDFGIWDKGEFKGLKYVPGVYKKTRISPPYPTFWARKRPWYIQEKSFMSPFQAQDFADKLSAVAQAETLEEALEIRNRFELKEFFLSNGIGEDSLGKIRAFAKKASDEFSPQLEIGRILAARALEQQNVILRNAFVRDALLEFGQRMPSTAKFPPAEGMRLYIPRSAVVAKTAKILDNLSDVEKELLRTILANNPAVVSIDDFAKLPEVKKIIKETEVWALPEDIAKELTKMSTRLTHREIQAMLRFYDKYILGPWKTMATVMRLPFHIRNAYSNLMLAWHGGVSWEQMPKLMKLALDIQLGKKGFIKNAAGERISYDEIRKIASQQGVRGKGVLFGEQTSPQVIEQIERYVMGGIGTKAKDIVMLPVRGARAFGVGVEDNARLVVFLNELMKASKGAFRRKEFFKQASAKVRKSMYDYTDLTDFEREVMRRVFPFYTWMRKNIPHQIELFFEQPEKMSAILKARKGAGEFIGSSDWEKGARPKYFNKYFYIKTPWETDAGKPIYAYVDLPVNDLVSLSGWEDFYEMVIGSITPLKLVGEIAANYKVFPRISMIEKFPDERVPAPFYVAWLLNKPGMKRILGIERMIDPETKRETIGMRKTALYVLETMFPFLKETALLYPHTLTLEEEAVWRKISYVTGIKFNVLDVEKQRLWNELDKKKKLGDVIKLMEQLNTVPTPEMLKEILKRR